MSEAHTILTPLPQLKLGIELSDYNFGDGFSIRPLEPQLQRSLINIAKERKCSDDCLQLLLESKSIFYAQIPTLGTRTDGSVFVASVYTTITTDIIKRIFRCLLLFQWVPAPLLIYCHFVAAGSTNDINMDTLKILNPDWEYFNIAENIDWRSSEVKPEDIALGLTLMQKYWDKLSEFCQIAHLKSLLTDKKKEKGIFASANEFVKQKVEELMKAKYGPDAVIVDDKNDANAERKSNDNDLPKSKISVAMFSRMFSDGLVTAYLKEIDKLSQELDKRVLNKRFDRAFQFFTGAFRVTEPHGFISFATCLETLFCTSRNEITFQLASRVAWFLSPGDYKKRSKIFTKVKSLYGLRSEIVHGVKHSPDKIEKSEMELITMLRSTFQKVLLDDCLYNIFRHKNQKVCDKYLEELNLGKINPDKIGDRNDRQN